MSKQTVYVIMYVIMCAYVLCGPLSVAVSLIMLC